MDTSIWRGRYLHIRTNFRIFKSLVIPVYGCEKWTLNTDLKRWSDVLATRCLRRIMGYRCYEFVSNQRLLRDSDLRPITSIVRQYNLRLYRHVAPYPNADPVVSERHNHHGGGPQYSWLHQVDASCWELLSMGKESAWGLARCDCRECRHGDASPGVFPHDWWIDWLNY